MSAGGWGCPHELNGHCGKVNNKPCDPGMKGCELYGRYAFFDGGKNERLRQKQQRAATFPAADKTALPPPDRVLDDAEAQPAATAGQAPRMDDSKPNGDAAVPKED